MRAQISSCVVIISLLVGSGAQAQTTQPSASATQPTNRNTSADDMLREMLRTTASGGAKPLQPLSNTPTVDQTTGTAAVAPGAPRLQVLREGTFIVDRTGRLTRSSDGQAWEFTFEADGRAMRDPPVVVLPNLKLMQMEDAVKGNRDLQFRITGMVTEYGGRNHVLLEKVVVVPDITQSFR